MCGLISEDLLGMMNQKPAEDEREKTPQEIPQDEIGCPRVFSAASFHRVPMGFTPITGNYYISRMA